MTLHEVVDKYPGVVAEVHYPLDSTLWIDGVSLPTYNTGVLTTRHPNSSHGFPVYIAGSNYRTIDPLVPGQVYGPTDLPAGYNMVILPYHYLTDPTCLSVAIVTAGYRCRVQED